MTLPFGLFDVPTQTGQTNPLPVPVPPQGAVPVQRPSIWDRIGQGVDRLIGVPQGLLDPDTQRFVRSQGLIGLGSGLLQASGPSPYPISIGQALGAAIPQGQAAAFGGLQNIQQLQAQQDAQRAAQARSQLLREATSGAGTNYQQVVSKLLERGMLDEAKQVAELAKSVREPGSRLEFDKQPDGSVRAFDPFTGELVNEYVPTSKGVTVLSPDDANYVNTVRDDLVKESGDLLDQANSFSRIQAAGADLRTAIQAGDRDAAAAAANFLVAGIAKLADPGSVVREPEFRRVATTGSITQRVEGIVEGLLSGTIPVSVLNSVMRQASAQMAAARTTYRSTYVASARARLQDRGLSAEVLREPDPFSQFGGQAPGPFVPPGSFEPSTTEQLFGAGRNLFEGRLRNLPKLPTPQLRDTTRVLDPFLEP